MIVDRMSHPTVYGARAKLGVIVPPTNTANEAEWNRMTPPGVTIHAARMKLHTDIKSLAGAVLPHRLVTRGGSETGRTVVQEILTRVHVPVSR